MHDVIVVGAGHAGIEAALATARMGADVVLVTNRRSTVGLMSCNPAVGGIGKGQLVREVDALGGAMARATDATGIHFRQLNTSKGGAVRSSRVQVDRKAYQEHMQGMVEREVPNLVEDMVTEVLVEGGRACGVRGRTGEYGGKTVVLAPGTFLSGLVHIGLESQPAGRTDEPPANELAEALRGLGLATGRFKTGTPPRLASASLDLGALTPQPGDDPPVPFSCRTRRIVRTQAVCYITHTTEKTHAMIRQNLDRSPLYTGKIKATGVRYCPSIEDKVVRFPDIAAHRVFLEPEGMDSTEYYPNGISNSLPADVQLELVRSIPGMERAEITHLGYGIEHDYVDPTQLFPWLEVKSVRNLFLAGQINGTTGYEEAAAQGIIAGINAARRAHGHDPFVLDRSQAYIGVLVDDLVTKGTDEPYRMFTSRVEYRLLLREDNADLRLGPVGNELGVLTPDEAAQIEVKRLRCTNARKLLAARKVEPSAHNNACLAQLGSSPIRTKTTCARLLLRPEIGLPDLVPFMPDLKMLTPQEMCHLELESKYQGYIERQRKDIERFDRLESRRIPDGIDYDQIRGLSAEVREKLKKAQPRSVGQAARIPGVTPAAVFVLLARLGR